MLLGDHREWSSGEASPANRPRNANGITYLGGYGLTNRAIAVRLGSRADSLSESTLIPPKEHCHDAVPT